MTELPGIIHGWSLALEKSISLKEKDCFPGCLGIDELGALWTHTFHSDV